MEHHAREEIEESLLHAIPRELPQYIDDAVFLEVQELLANHPDNPNRAWSASPRLYTLLRILGHHDDTPVFHKFEAEQIGDFWLPLGPSILSQLSASVGLDTDEWRRAQYHVLSRPEMMGGRELLSPVHAHRYIRSGSSYFEPKATIGKGSSAEVSRVCHKLSGREYACKRILRKETIREQREQLIEFVQEVDILRRIAHHHVVSFVASYTDLESFSMILSPVAKQALKSVLERQSREQPLPDSDICTLRRAFGCLATAITYVHEQKVRHKDIKPGNILLSNGRVYLCDFGIARDWSMSDASTTEGDVLKYTRRYVASEVFDGAPRNTKADIWSLGCVFLEILSVVKGYPLDEMNTFISKHSVGDSERVGLWCAPEAISAWLTRIRSEKNDSADDIPIDWITQMVRIDPQARPDSSALLDMIHRQSAHLPLPDLFVGRCCSRADSIIPTDTIDSPTLHGPEYTDNAPISLQSVHLLNLPHRNSLPSSIERRSRELSISPRTTPATIRDPTENASEGFQLSSLDSNPSDVSDFVNDFPHMTSSRSRSRWESSYSRSYPAESDSSSVNYRSLPPVPPPPPANFAVECNCAPRLNEKHIFNTLYATADMSTAPVPFQIISEARTIENCNCEVGENKIQIYESPPQDPSNSSSTPMIWWVTRRLVVSHLAGNPETRRCSSFWLPLADIQFTLMNDTVTLIWSDCSQVTRRTSGDYGWLFDWKYNPKDPNNNINIRFSSSSEAQQFIDAVRLPYEDGVTVSRCQRVGIPDGSEISTFDVGRPGFRSYRVATLTTVSPTISTSKTYVVWPEVDIDMRFSASCSARSRDTDYEITVVVNNVTTPSYQSDSCGEPALDDEKIARFHKALQMKASMHTTFPIGPGDRPSTPPNAVVNMLRGLTGWTLRYFAIVAKFRSKNKRFGFKKYGRADVMLWIRDDKHTNRPNSALTFRLHEEVDFLWMSGSLGPTAEVNTAGLDATITVNGKTRGKLLDVSKMTAIISEAQNYNRPTIKHSRTRSIPYEDDISELVLTFEEPRSRLELVNLIEDFKSSATLFDGSFHRINSRAFGISPPIR